MITEKKFARDYQSFWKMHTPFFTDFYNSDASVGSRISKSCPIIEESHLKAHTNLLAFAHFKNLYTKQDRTIAKSFEDLYPILCLYPLPKGVSFQLTDEIEEIIRFQSIRLLSLYSGRLILDPYFPGVGIMPGCRGDIIRGTTLIEIKAGIPRAGRKMFNPEDFRQLLVYCALNYANSEEFLINQIQLFNPRTGILWKNSIDEFVYRISNLTPVSLYSAILDELERDSDKFN